MDSPRAGRSSIDAAFVRQPATFLVVATGESRARGASPWLWLGPPLVFGALLRLWGIQRQVLGGDEFHALQRAASYPLGNILTHYDLQVDHSVPLTAWVR